MGLGLKEIPDIYQMEQGLSKPKEHPAQAKALIHIHTQLVNIVLQEAYQAARESMRNSGAKRKEQRMLAD